MSADDVKLAKKAARKAVEDSGADGIDLLALIDEVLDDYPDALEELAKTAFGEWIEHTVLRQARTDKNTPRYGLSEPGRWKQTEFFTIDEKARAIERRVKSIRKDVEMVTRMADELSADHGVRVWVPQWLWPDDGDIEKTG